MEKELIKLTQFSKGGGCGCKIAPSVLEKLLQTDSKHLFSRLLVGNENSDDAAAYLVNDEMAIVSTTDFFLPIVDDAFDFGRIAAANSISDVYAMGATPLMAIAILGWPIDKLPLETAKQMLEGARTVCKEANIPLAGGHTIDSNDPIFGLAVTGQVHVKHLKKNNTAREGDFLFLTKPVGGGVLSTALKRALLNEAHYNDLLHHMAALNKIGENLGKITGVHAMTDVTGFGLLGHLIEMASGSGLSAEIFYTHINKMEGVAEYLKKGVRPDATSRNWNSYSNKVQFEKGLDVMEAFGLLPDPQTNGGLLISVAEDAVEEVTGLLSANGYGNFLRPIGRIVGRAEKAVIVKSTP